MRKLIYLPILLLTLIFGITEVKADENYNVYNFYSDYEFLSTIDSSIIDNLISYYNNNFASTYKYYFIVYDPTINQISLRAVNNNQVYYTNQFGLLNANAGSGESYYYNFTDGSYNYYGYIASVWEGILYSTSTDFIFNDSSSCNSSGCLDFLTLPSYENSDLGVLHPLINIEDGDEIPTYTTLINGDYIKIPTSYVEIDLNKYPYVILSLKDYTARDTFTSTMYVKGQLCPTTLYNYGMEEKKDYISGYQTQPCSYYYNNFVPFTTYIKSEDIKNHAVYYLTSYDKSKPNLVKVDTSVYDITYITSENKDDPYVSIGGKNYPTLSYDSLTDSSTLTEQNGISGEWTCAKYDTDCLTNSSGMNVNDLFDKPLEFLKGLWSSITSIFEVITEFISLLPPTMQSFLYLSFMVAIVLGLLKLIL